MLYLHADDLGISRAISDNIFDCFSVLSSASIAANGEAFDYAVQVYRERYAGKALSVHLNLVEGRPCAPADQVPLLVNADGYLCQSFGSLLLASLRGDRPMAQQVRLELAAQIRRVRDAFGDSLPLRLDSHQHLHMVPLVFRQIVALRDEFPIAYVRLPCEPIFFCRRRGAMAKYAGAGLVKHLLLKLLSARGRRELAAAGIATTDAFIGVLFTGDMSPEVVDAALAAVARASAERERVVEILFHPGGGSEAERTQWQRQPDLAAYYLSRARQAEKQALLSADLVAVLRKYGKVV